MMTGRAAEEIIIVCLDALMFAKSVLWKDSAVTLFLF